MRNLKGFSMKKIVLVGFAGCGKNTVGEYLVERYGYVGMSFADALKDAVSAIFCWDRTLLEGNTPEAREWRETIDPWWAEKLNIPDFTPRWMLRNFGTEIMRNHFNPDIWISNVERRILDLGPNANVVVFDGRFPNEINLVRQKFNGTAIRVKRGPEPDWFDMAGRANFGDAYARSYLGAMNVHSSEFSWIGTNIDLLLENDGTVYDLQRRVDSIAEKRMMA
jgi:hypothetical protein